MNFANSQLLVKDKATGTPHGVYYIQPLLASDVSIVRCQECFLYTYTGVGLSALYQRCTLKDDISYLLPTWLSAGTGKLKRKHHFIGWQERTNKMKNKSCATNFATQHHFPCYFYFKNHFYWRKEKRCVTCLWLQPKPIHKYKFIHLRIYILMDWMNWTNCGAIAQSCHVQYWVVALFLSASKNSCMISVTFHL